MTTEQTILLAVGLIVAFIGACLLTRVFRKITRWNRSLGTVERYEENDERAEFAVVSFIDHESRKIEFRSSVSGRIKNPVSVLYDPAFPLRASVAGFWQLWFIPFAFLLAGLAIAYLSTLAK
jgi:hypothetical protein